MPVHLFVGPNRYLKQKAFDELKSSVQKNSSGLDFKAFDAADTGFSQISDFVNTIPFLSSHRIAHVRNVEKFHNEDLSRLKAYTKKIPKSAYLVLDSDKDDPFSREEESFTGLAVKRFANLDEGALHNWIRDFVKSRSGPAKMKIGSDAVRELEDLHGDDLFVLSNELEKLIAFREGRGDITLQDVLDISGRSLYSSAFDLTRAIEKNSVDEALGIVSDLVVNGKKHYEIIGLLCWHIKRLLRAKVMLSRDMPEARIAYALKVGASYKNEFFRQVKSFGLPRLKDKLKALLDADLDIKRSRLDPTLVLEFVILKLCLV